MLAISYIQEGAAQCIMDGNDLFSDQELKKMIAPLFLEQLLVMFVGLADTLVISYAGESAVSGV